jgi:[protein-PII] uridylyltransferase
MATGTTPASELRDFHSHEFARIHEDFQRTGNGRAALVSRTALVETIARRLWERHISADPQGPEDVTLAALGGFGRAWLFPYSDVDILFLHAGGATEEKLKDQIRSFSQGIWDLRLKLSPATRTLAECDRVDPDNFEFAMSLLDARYLAGDRRVFARLHDQVIPKLVAREADQFIKRLSDLTRSRHAKFGDTVFHLEPNVKDGPGGMRDYNVASWLALLSAMEQLRAWPVEGAPLAASARPALDRALEFLMAVRCFLHFRHARDDNSLAWDAQEEVAAQRVGLPAADDSTATPLAPSDWMRVYFSHARRVHRICLQLLEELPTTRPSLYRQFQNLRSRLSNPEFSVVGNLVFFRQTDSPPDAAAILRCFRFLARHGLYLSSAAESRIEQSLPTLAKDIPAGAELWHPLQDILTAPHAADALRAMHSLHLLTLLIPEFAGVDSLVVRDYSHRFTVDEHTFVAIDNLHQLRQSQSKWDQRYAELLDELEQPDLLYLTILLHDIGKGAKSDNHVDASVLIAEGCLERLDLDELDRETVLFLVGRHLEMSAALRRDIFDPETIHAFAEKVETPERLKMLSLLTYADIKAVNPEALTPWKAENIWQLYIATANHMNRSLDERVHADARDDVMTHLRTLAPAAGKRLDNFLEGLPRRYLLTHAAGEVLSHMEMAARPGQNSVQLNLGRGRHWYELTVVTPDRPFLFATIAGVLASWGMNIVKATAFSNSAGTVVDTFYFTDRFRTLDLNIPEWERFKTSVHEVLLGKADLERLLRARQRSEKEHLPKVKVKTKVDFDDVCSAHSTLIEVIAKDQPGLLHRISLVFAREKCNIEIALIETEGQTALDVFYLTSSGAKLSPDHQSRLAAALLAELGV